VFVGADNFRRVAQCIGDFPQIAATAIVGHRRAVLQARAGFDGLQDYLSAWIVAIAVIGLVAGL